MPDSSVPYLHSSSLRQRYCQSLQHARQQARLDDAALAWLQSAVAPVSVDSGDPVRIDRLIPAQAAHRHGELSASLLFSHAATDAPEVYLYSLSAGIECIASRHELLVQLRARYAAGAETALFEYEKIDGDPFQAQMLAIVDHQADEVRAISACLKQIPGLPDAAGLSLDSSLSAVQTHSEQLKTFWQRIQPDARSSRALAIETLKSSLRDQLYRREASGLLNSASRKALFDGLQLLPGSAAVDPSLQCRRLAIRVGDSALMPLAATFVVIPSAQAQAQEQWLWFAPDRQLLGFSGLAALTEHLSRAQGRAQLSGALAIEDRHVLQREGLLQVVLEPCSQSAGAQCIDSIIDLQARNLRYASERNLPGADRTAMIDDALDIRSLLDPRQLALPAGRWRREAPFEFTLVWPDPRPAEASTLQVAGSGNAQDYVADAGSNPSWREQTRDLDKAAEHLRQLDNTLLDYATQELLRYVCVWDADVVELHSIQVQWDEPPTAVADGVAQASSINPVGPARSCDVRSWLLECVTGLRTARLPHGARVVRTGENPGQSFPVALVEHALSQVCDGFAQGYVACFEQSRRQGVRQGDTYVRPCEQALALRTKAMRLYLSLAVRQNWVDSVAAGLISRVLDQPIGASRNRSDAPAVEVFTLCVNRGGTRSAVLSDTLVIRQPQVALSPVVVWSGVSGWLSLSSLEHLSARVVNGLGDGSHEPWRELLGERDRQWLCDYHERAADHPVQVRLERVEGHALQALQQGVLQRQLQDLQQVCPRATRSRLKADPFTQLAAQAEVDASLYAVLDGLSLKVEMSLLEALLPPWLNDASVEDLGLYCELLKRYYMASDGGKDFLFDIPSMHRYAREQLLGRLTVDFPGQDLDPNLITVTSRSFVSAFPAAGELPSAVPAATVVHSESLTEYAINRFAPDQGSILSVSCTEHPLIAQTMTSQYLRTLARSLNVGAGYIGLLRKALSPDAEHFAVRKRLFVEQLPPMLLAVALTEKLKGHLSAQAYDLLSSVFEMPDGIAREPVNGVRALLSPLQLVADEGMTPDTVTGFYIVCSQDIGVGPLVLYIIHHSLFTLREYPSQAALLEDIRTDPALQQVLLQRLEPEVQRRYDHGGFVEPHLPFSVEGLGEVPFSAPGPVTLGIEEVKGNALQFLFEHTVKLLLDIGISNVVTNAQENAAGRAFLTTLGIEQVLSLLPSKLAAMVTLWQSQSLLQASATSVSERHWGEAFSEFTAALGVMVTAREQARLAHSRDEQRSAESGGAAPDEQMPTASTWPAHTLDPEQVQRLRGLQVQGLSLKDLRHDNLLNLYVDASTDKTYAVVSGKVYQVRHLEQDSQWIIVGADGSAGPKIMIDDNQHWRLDLRLRLRGGGGSVTKYKATKAERSAKDILVVEASGMPEIRLLYRDRARRIGQAHLQAKRYLETCLDNLSPHQSGQSLDVRANRIITDFFGITAPSTALLDDTLNAAKAIFAAIMDPSLSPFSSQRFVVGTTRPGHERVTAFVLKSDPKKRIYLTEEFFLPPVFAIRPDALAKGFSPEVHYRAANLIHELSHLVLDTQDIAYLNAMAPYPDLMLDDTPDNVVARDHVRSLHETRLSHRGQRDELFTLVEAGIRRDIEPDDGRGFDTILKMTRRRTLDEARDVFMSDDAVRGALIQANADSLTLLLLLLGRENFVLPSP